MTTPILLGSSFRVNSVTTGAQEGVSATGLSNGRLFLVYDSHEGATASDWMIERQIMLGSGTTRPAATAIQPNGATGQPHAMVQQLADGNVLVVWADQHDAADRAIRGRIYTAAGTQVGVDFNLNTTTAGDQAFPSITALQGGGFVAVWQDNSTTGGDASGYGIRAVVYGANYLPGTEFLVNTTTAGAQVDAHVTALAGGGFAVTWLDTGATGANPAKFVERARVYDATGAAVSGEIALDITRGSMPAEGEVSAQVVGLSDGSVAFVWVSHEIAGSDTSGASIRTAIYSATGVLSHAEVQVNTTTAGDQDAPTAIALNDGRYMVAWIDASAGAGNEVIRAQVMNADGTKSFSEFVAHSAGFTGGSAPVLTELADGRVFLSWSNPDPGFDGDAAGIAGQYIDPRIAGINLTGTAGADRYFGSAFADSISGGTGADRLTGGAGNDVLNGGGGRDTLVGGSGDDIYYVNTASDVLIETAGNGTADRVRASASYTLAAGHDVEFLSTASAAGTTAINLTGNGLAQNITGNAGANRLLGGGGDDSLFGLDGADTLNGGDGTDVLNGGAGADSFVFNAALGAGNVDRIIGYVAADDRIMLDNAVFTGLANGGLNAAAFAANTTGLAGDASDRIIYETDTGALYFDADGTGAAAGIRFATLAPNLVGINNGEFLVF